ncbi:MAG: ABC transporter ATP-binding protein [Planctomycetota bacterium]
MIKLTNLRKTFGPIVAVDDLTLEIRRGEVFGLLGPNGAGKTTTVNLAIGLLRPDAGTVELDGQGSPENAAVRRRIGVSPQEMAIYDELTGEENVSFFGRLQGLTGRELAKRVAWSLDFVGLTDRRRDRAKTYSGGMQRRLNLAIALVHDPDLLLLDEPTVGVDPQSRNAIFERIEALQERGRTIVYTTHYMEEAQRLCDRVCIIDHGKILALDTVDALIATYGGKSVVRAQTAKGETRIETNDPVAELKRLQEAGTLRHFRVDRPDLEQVFLSLTGRHLRD